MSKPRNVVVVRVSEKGDPEDDHFHSPEVQIEAARGGDIQLNESRSTPILSLWPTVWGRGLARQHGTGRSSGCPGARRQGPRRTSCSDFRPVLATALSAAG